MLRGLEPLNFTTIVLHFNFTIYILFMSYGYTMYMVSTNGYSAQCHYNIYNSIMSFQVLRTQRVLFLESFEVF